MKVGLTGNICCGKSTISREFERLGARVIDADRLSGEYLDNHVREIEKIFPSAISYGKIDRVDKKLVAAEVFSNPEKLKKLEAVIHPYVFKRIEEFANEDKEAINISEASLIFEKNAQNKFDKTIVVYSPYEVSRERAKLRNLSDGDFNRRWSLQMPLEEKARLADFVIDNSVDGTGQAKSVYERLFSWNTLKNERVYDEVVRRYSEPGRKYHNLTHLFNCFKEFNRAKHLMQNPEEVKMALAFHDAIYDSHEKDNEEKSAQLAERFGANEKVRSLIMSTKHLGQKFGDDRDYIMDIDISIFGQDWKTFSAYEKGIRQEYDWVSDEDFKNGRMSVLGSFLNRKSIFATQFFREEYEMRARKNLFQSLMEIMQKA